MTYQYLANLRSREPQDIKTSDREASRYADSWWCVNCGIHRTRHLDGDAIGSYWCPLCREDA